jgi:hypothetical protein
MPRSTSGSSRPYTSMTDIVQVACSRFGGCRVTAEEKHALNICS